MTMEEMRIREGKGPEGSCLREKAPEGAQYQIFVGQVPVTEKLLLVSTPILGQSTVTEKWLLMSRRLVPWFYMLILINRTEEKGKK